MVISRRHKLDIYGKKVIKIPIPHYFVLYNGSEEAPDKQELKLSDAFEHKVEGYAKLISYIRENS